MGSASSSTALTYCNVTLWYTHTGKGDKPVVKYAFPDPSGFHSRFYVTSGGDAGYDAFSNSYDDVVLYGNGSTNWDRTYMFGYQAFGEMTNIGKPLTHYSDGSEEGMSRVQRCPACRLAQQQINHVFPAVIKQTLDYYSPICALDKIINATIAACDPLDSRTDDVTARTDLCKLQLDMKFIIGASYNCAA
ncbi:tannase and feruloyl esterase-domain-containing protein [Xylaria sp. FL0064]|nr:tannase and feruloyl esterase-domain-containing protein [Xylaria sp. FL0064]